MSGTGLERSLEERHFATGDAEALSIRVHRPGAPLEDALATLIEISRSGAKLSTEGCLPIGEELSLTLDSVDSAFPAKVCWTQPVEDDWRVGCSFDPPLSEATIATLASAGHLQRRHDYRKPVSVEAKVRWESTSECIPVRIVDVSAGGLCFQSDQNSRDSQRIAVELDSDSGESVLVLARVQWKRDTDDGYLYGCEFASQADRAALEACLEPSAVEEAEEEIDEPARIGGMAELSAIFVGSLIVGGLLGLLTV